MSENILVALVAGLLGLLPAIFEWLSDRRKSRSRHNQITRLANELEFLERWFNLSKMSWSEATAQQLGISPHQSLQTDLNRILIEYRAMRVVEQEELEDRAKSYEISLVRRMLLLFRPSTFLGSIVHSAFYFLEIVFITLTVPNFDLLPGNIMVFGPPILLLQRVAIIIRNREIKRRSRRLKDERLA